MSLAAAPLPQPAAPRQQVVLGILAAIGGAAALSVSDLAIKLLSGHYPLYEVILTRALIAFGFLLVLIPASGRHYRILRTRRPGMHLARVSIVMLSNLTFFLGLAALPFANAQAIGFAAPLIITILSVVALHEKVGLHRWGAVIVGLVGVLIMLRPDAQGTVQPAAILVLIAAFCYALGQTITRALRATESPFTINFYTQTGFIVVAASMGFSVGNGRFAGSPDAMLSFLFRAWTWPAASDLPLFLATGLAVAVGGLLLSQAYQMNETALTAPFEYTSMPLGIFWGFAFFHTFPDFLSWIGIVLICGAGLYVLWRETVRRRERGS